MSLRGPVLTLTARREAPSLMGRVDGPEKCPLNFFILCGYMDYVYICLRIDEIKIVTNIFLGFKISCQVVSRGQKF